MPIVQFSNLSLENLFNFLEATDNAFLTNLIKKTNNEIGDGVIKSFEDWLFFLEYNLGKAKFLKIFNKEKNIDVYKDFMSISFDDENFKNFLNSIEKTLFEIINEKREKYEELSNILGSVTIDKLKEQELLEAIKKLSRPHLIYQYLFDLTKKIEYSQKIKIEQEQLEQKNKTNSEAIKKSEEQLSFINSELNYISKIKSNFKEKQQILQEEIFQEKKTFKVKIFKFFTLGFYKTKTEKQLKKFEKDFELKHERLEYKNKLLIKDKVTILNNINQLESDNNFQTEENLKHQNQENSLLQEQNSSNESQKKGRDTKLIISLAKDDSSNYLEESQNFIN